MDDSHFDQLTRVLSAHRDRRGLPRLLGGGLAGLLAIRGRGGAAEERCGDTRCTQTKVCHRGRCRFNAKWVGSRCEHHGPACKFGSICTATGKKAGKCVCPSGLTRCGRKSKARCRDLRSDTFNCGGCDRACLSGATTCQNGSCCTVNGVGCPAGCGPGNYCAGCCAGTCRLDGTCGPITDCLLTDAACPSGCTTREACPGCCDGTCDANGKCSPNGCVRYGLACTQSADCCLGVPCSGQLCRYN